MSEPPLSDVDFKNKMAWVWTILKMLVTETVAKKYVTNMTKTQFLFLFRRHEQMGSGNSYTSYTRKDNYDSCKLK